ncbi:MAG: GTPase Era [Lachnospiraceae bacterium]|nr:GTPase Era [Lachnospiraceae bacterium]
MSDTHREDFRCGVVTLIGRPNTGKSTLMNRLIGQKVAITSHKPQTTRGQIRTIFTDDEAQIIFLDTPGIHIAKNKLGQYMVSVARGALKDIDAVLFMAEPVKEIDEVERDLLKRLSKADVPVLIILNKEDLFPEEERETARKLYETEAPFAEVTSVSALKGEGTEALLQTIKGFLPYGEPLYDEDALTDVPVRDIAAEIIREKALRLLSDEVPHGIAVQIEKMRERETKTGEAITDISASIVCERDSHKGIVIGKGGRMLKKIGQTAREDIERMLDGRVNLQLFVKVRKDWRDDETQLKSLGYRK